MRNFLLRTFVPFRIKVSVSHTVLLATILLGIGFIFRASLGYFFVQDDFVFLSRLARVRELNDIFQLFLQNDHFYRPMARVVMLGIPYALFATEPVGYHFFNLGLHLINTLLVYCMLRTLGAGRISATLGMGVYGSYPAHFTPLVWVAGIQELSVTFFVLVSVLAFTAWSRQLSSTWKYILAIISYGAALLSKETAIFLPVWLGVMDYFSRIARQTSEVKWKSLAFGQSGFVLISFVYLLVRRVKADVTGDSGPYTVNLGLESLRNNLRFYVLDLYGLHETDLVFAPWLVGLTLAGFVLLVLLPNIDRLRIVIGVAWVLLVLAPTMVLVNRHYAYYFSLATIGVTIIISTASDYFGTVWLWRERHKSVIGGVLFLVMWMSWAYFQTNVRFYDKQNLKYKSDRARQVVCDLRSRRPDFQPGLTLCVIVTNKDDMPVIANGSLFTFFYPTLEPKHVIFNACNPALLTDLNQSDIYIYALPPK